MRSLERHGDVGAYALGVLDEAEAFRFEDHLMECPRCTAHVSEFRPATRQLMLYRRSTPRTVHPFAAPGPRLLDRLLAEVTARNRAGRRRLLYAVAASVVLAAGGPAIVAVAAHDAPAHRITAAGPRDGSVTATDADTGVWAQVTTTDRVWGTDVDVRVKDPGGPRSCRLVAVGKDGTEETVTSWMVPPHDGAAQRMRGGAALRSGEIGRFEVRTADGEHLVTLKAP
ncbi:anti-sigma factor family protein [Streptomyces sp. NPDC048566]|uniref:anti-sigma factor family protein n=1 Tax=Streptomyces sp. NPDC048566 TaxID=3365569 RepID=UPI00370FECDB